MAAFLRVKMFNLTVDEINFYSFLAFPLLLHRLLLRRLRPFEGSGCFYRSMKYHAMNIYTRINLAVLFLAVASLLIQVYVHSDDFTKTAIGIPNAISAILIVSKGSVTFFQRKRIWAIIQEVKFVHESKSKANVKESVKAHLDFYHRVSKVYAGICFFLFLPVVLPIFQFILFDEMKLTTEYWYPFDEYSRENYLFAFVWLVYVTANYLITLVASDILLFALITLIVLELDILRIDFEELRTISNASRARKLKELISHHERVLEICDKLQDIYGPTFLISFVISSLVICFVAFQLSTNSSDTEAVVFFIPYLGMIAGQVYLKCVFGQRLINSSLSVAQGAFESGWERTDDSKLTRQLLLIIERAQKPKRLTAMNFAEVSHETFTKILTTAGSYYSLLKSVSSND